MSDKVENLSKHRNRKKPRTIEAAAEAAFRRFIDGAPHDLPEPKGLASGDMDKMIEGKDADDGEDDEKE